MKLSEAMRLGAMLRPQVRGAFWGRGGSCALGAALEAAGVPTTAGPSVADAAALFPIILRRVVPPAPLDETVLLEKTVERVWAVITALNDNYGWTREQIAGWVETVEAVAEAEADTPTPCAAAPRGAAPALAPA